MTRFVRHGELKKKATVAEWLIGRRCGCLSCMCRTIKLRDSENSPLSSIDRSGNTHHIAEYTGQDSNKVSVRG